ncbi:vigilin-like [Pomacea canaliculata]|uniref:vigilin-like n=1 Tax=Pomacea canaliculata TaxID=400727 RepID=UPI000D729244|nr:vigilin-like [Pomacea canaliculata]
MASNMDGEVVPSVDEQAFDPEPPTYDAAFPALPSESRHDRPLVNAGPWQPKFQSRSSRCTQVFTVPVEERKFREMNEHKFGDESEQSKICKDIMQKTGVSIEISLAKDQSMTVVINGRSESVLKARREIVGKLQTQASITIKIPREHHRFILGKSGKKLQELELTTATKITIPRPEENTDSIKISGTKEGIDKARHEIECISEEQAKLAFERLPVPKAYHPFVCGPFNQNIKQLMEETGARINVPPASVDKDEIVVSGEKEGVAKCKQVIMGICDEKRRKCQTVSVEVSKSQHRYVIGPRGSNIQEILAATGVAVDVPPLETPSETITLRGEQDKLGPALTMVYSKANSVIFSDVVAPAWLHRFVIGRKGASIKKITEDFPKVHIEFTEGQDKITVEGPPEEVQEAVHALEQIISDLKMRMDYAEIVVDQKFHKHIIGKNGVNITRIKNETGVSVRIPSDGDNSNIIRIEGDPAGVAKAKQELQEMALRMENETSRDIIIEQRFHGTIIGARGENIREIREKFNQVQITFPDPGKKSDVVTLRGPKNDVDKCYKHLQTLHKEMIESNYQAQVHIFKDFHKNIIGKGGANIKKIRDETNTRIELPSEHAESDVITITGKKADVELARSKIEDIQKELANIKEMTVEIPHRLHNSIIGSKGRLIRAIMEECGGVIIRFPPEGTTSDKVTIRGPKDDVENARKQLLDLVNEKKESSFTAEIRAKPQYHKFLIGRGGANIKKVRENTATRIIFPASGDADQELITIMGKEENVKQAKEELQTLIKNLDNVVEAEMTVDAKHHRFFVARRGEVLRNIAEEYGGVAVSFPRSGVKSDKVTIKGSKDCVEAAKKKIAEMVADLEAQVTVECVIPQQYHRTIMGAGGSRVREVTRVHEVGIKFPDKPVANGKKAEEEEDAVTNGDVNNLQGSNKLAGKSDIIIITGKPENCERARQALLDLVPVTEEVPVPFDMHRFIIGQKGRDVRRMMEEYDVNISIPPATESSDIVRVTGPPENVKKARAALEDKVAQLEAEKEDRALKSFQLKIEVDPQHHPKIIGKRGAIISKIRADHDVNIQFPDRSDENPNVITITGYEENACRARDEIMNIVKELEDMTTESIHIDHRIHSRIIGSKGRAVRRLMDDFRVDIRFPRSESTDPDLVVITGPEEAVLDCKDHLLNLQEEYLQDVVDMEYLQDLQHPPSKSQTGPQSASLATQGFVVRDAPWDRAPDTNSTEEFPSFGAVVAPKSGHSWGPGRKY